MSSVATGAGLTAVIQSSSVTTVLVVGFVSAGLMSLNQAVGVIMGANIGTCVTALPAAIGKSTEAKQTSAIHLLFNLIGIVIWLPVINLIAFAATSISPSHLDLDGIERLAAETPRQIANANTMFNIANTLIMLPFSALFVAAVKKLVPHHTAKKEHKKIQHKYIKKEYLATPDIALEQAHLEIGRLGRRVTNMVNRLPPLADQPKDENDKKLLGKHYARLKK
ncbi:Na/Pi symporter [Vibrio europaeus]|uniref:Na/Pi symporter n=1 Tax=Vibrio europaeus TaxID=300876 RepID=UPI0023422ADA|nr:Na/Pi symporter [Vibrio europaeus]MDC5840427.1 Na/Pi symporter [Vibrio europaeus]